MYHLQHHTGKGYRWLAEHSSGSIQATYWLSFNFLIAHTVDNLVFSYVYTSMEDVRHCWPTATILLSTEDPSTITQTYPELFL